MTKERLLTVALIVLVLINVITAVLYFGKKGIHEPKGPKNLIIEKLSFDDEQSQAYEVLISSHRSEILELERDLIELKESLYPQMNDIGTSEEILSSISQVQSRIESVHLQHFRQIEAICRDDQKAAFNELTQDIAKMFAPRGPKKPRK